MELLNKIIVKKPSKFKKKPRPMKSSLKSPSLYLDNSMDSKSHQSKHQSRQATNAGSLPVSSIKVYILAPPRVCQCLKLLAIPYHLMAIGCHQQLHQAQAVPINIQLLFSLIHTAMEV